MARSKNGQQPGSAPAADADRLEDELRGLSVAGFDTLRSKWRERYKADPPPALSKDIIARALSYDLQEDRLGGLEPRLRRLLDRSPTLGAETDRHVKVGSVIVREYGGIVHEVMVVPGGFCWQGQIHSGLSTIARHITGTNWNGHRFFGLRGQAAAKQIPESSRQAASQGAAPTADAMASRHMTLRGIRRRKGARAT